MVKDIDRLEREFSSMLGKYWSDLQLKRYTTVVPWDWILENFEPKDIDNTEVVEKVFKDAKPVTQETIDIMKKSNIGKVLEEEEILNAAYDLTDRLGVTLEDFTKIIKFLAQKDEETK